MYFNFASQIYSDIFILLILFSTYFGIQYSWQYAWFGTTRSWVRVPLSRPYLGIFDMVSRLHCSLSIFFFARRLQSNLRKNENIGKQPSQSYFVIFWDTIQNSRFKSFYPRLDPQRSWFSASRLHREGRLFESDRVHKFQYYGIISWITLDSNSNLLFQTDLKR